jgi:hypothetical protein
MNQSAMPAGTVEPRGESSGTVVDAVNRYMADNGFSRAEYRASSVPIKAGPFTFQLPNGPSRQRAIAQHDIHHVITGYGTDLAGEAEIGAWELRGGCTSAFLWAINLAAVAGGLILAPRRVLRAFRRARGAKTLYALGLLASEVEGLSVEELRRRVGFSAVS